MCDYPLYEKTFTSRRALKRKKNHGTIRWLRNVNFASQ